MKVIIGDSQDKIQFTLNEIKEIIDGRVSKAKMSNPENNPLIDSYNNGVDILAKYIKEYIGSEFDKVIDELRK